MVHVATALALRRCGVKAAAPSPAMVRRQGLARAAPETPRQGRRCCPPHEELRNYNQAIREEVQLMHVITR